MAPIQLTLFLCSYMLSISGLPITSKPLDNNADHLTWEAWLMVDSRNPADGGKTRKITPKSIFIAPNINSSAPSMCQQGYKIDSSGKCIQIVNIDQNDILLTRVQSIFSGSSANNEEDDGDVYDYGDYDTDPGPFQINIPLNIDITEDEISPPLALKGESIYYDTTDREKIKQTFLNKQDQKPDESNSEISFLAFENHSNGSISTDVEFERDNDTIRKNILLPSILPPTTPVETTTDPLPTTTDFITTTDSVPVTTTQLIEEVTIITNYPDIVKTTEMNSDAMTTTSETISETEQDQDYTNETLSLFEDNYMTNDTKYDEELTLKMQLEQESFMMENTTESSMEFTDFTTEQENVTTITATETILVTVPATSERPVHIVTPVRWHPVISATVAPKPASLIIVNDTATDKKNREDIMRLEHKDSIRENIDSNNRFVYHHLPSASTSSQPPVNNMKHEAHIMEQLKVINDIVEENRRAQAENGMRVRFPTREEESGTFNNVRFPGSVASRVPPLNRIGPDIFPKKSQNPVSSTMKPPFWWLPTGWEVDQTGQKPMLLRFWSRMPLIRDSTANPNPNRWRTPSSSPITPRENSKSPSENFYKEVSSQDVYKVFNMRNTKHNR